MIKKILLKSFLQLLLMPLFVMFIKSAVFAYPMEFVSDMPSVGNDRVYGPKGTSFTVGANDIRLISIGLFDHKLDTIKNSRNWQLWTGGGGIVGTRSMIYHYLHSSLDHITDGALVNQHRYFDLEEDIILNANESYTVTSWGAGNSEPAYNETIHPFTPVEFSDVGLRIGLGGSYYFPGANPDLYEWSDDGPSKYRFGNASFQYEIITSPVPEPGTHILFGFGILGLAGLAKRRLNIGF